MHPDEARSEKPETQRNIRPSVRIQRLQSQDSRIQHPNANRQERADGCRLDTKKAVRNLASRQGLHEELHAGISRATYTRKSDYGFLSASFRIREENRELGSGEAPNPKLGFIQDIDFSEIAENVETDKQTKLNMTSEDKKQQAERKIKREELKDKFGYRRS